MVYSSNSETFHRNNPSILTDQLYLAAYCALSHARLHELGITCIINATLELPTMASQKHDAMQIAVEDRVASKLYVYFDLVADKIHSVHNSGGKVMIYCRAGMSRSASLCIAYFMRHKGMNLEEAFDYVKNCRPIIHPNVGFMRQLREYEAKVLARNSRQKLNIVTNPTAAGVKRKHSTAMGRGPLVIGEPLPDILYAEEQVCDEIDVPILEDIPKRPKPRILKPKPWMPDRLMESYQIHTVQVLGDSKLDTIEEPAMAMNKTLINRTQTPNKGRKRHLSKQKNATVGISKEALGVALSRCDTPLIDVCPTDQDKSQLKEPNGIIPSTHQPTAPPRRKPFTKVNMESTKIPVSSLTVPMGMCAEFKKGQRLGDLFSREKAITLSSFMTGCKGEGVLVTATEHHELILECCSDSIISDISIQPVIASSNLTSDARSCNTNNSSQIDLTSSRNISNKNISRHSLCSSSNSRHSYSSQRHQPYPSNITSSRFKITSSSACDNEFSSLNERARCMICPPLTGVATVCIPQVYECSGIYRRQNLPGNLTDTASISHFKEPPPLPSVSNVPSRFSSMSSSQSSSAFSRAAASRKSIKLSEGLKISPMPTKFNKRSEIILPKSNEYFSVAIAYCQPIILERTQELKTLKRLSNLHSNIKAKMKLYAPSLGVAEITENIFQTGRVYENVSPNVNSDFNVAHLLTYPRRTAILSSGYVTVYDNIPGVYPSSNEESVFHTIPSKEYPYYSPHHVSYSSSSAAMNKLQRATIEPTVESSWFFESSIRPHIAKIIDQQTKKKSEVDQGVVTVKIQKPAEKEKVNTTASASVKIRLLKEPEVRWAAERCEYQPDFLCTKPIPDLIKPDKAKWNIVTRAMNLSRGDDSNNKDKRPLRYDQYSTLDHTEYQMVGLGDLKHIPKRPESYYAWYIMQMCAYPLYQSATCSENPIYENTNMYCEPTPFKDYAKVTKHSNMGNVKGSYDKGFCVAVVETSDVVNNLEELIDIPSDMVGGIAEMKKLCQNKYVNESTMEIWIGVIKASILRSRPMYPLVSIEEPLCIANICDVSTLILEDPLIFDTNTSKSLPFPNLPSKYPSLMMPSVLRARAMPLTVQRQPINNLKELNQALLFPLEVTECVCVDAFHTTTGPLKNNNINAKKEKCSESRTYIRDYTISYWSEPIEEFMVLDLVNILEDVIPFTAIRTVEPKMPRITAITNYNILFGEVQGNPSSSMPVGMKLLTKGGSSNSSASNLLQLQRKPFSIVSGLRPVVEICHKNILHAESTLPVYDISNQSKQHATSVTQSETKSEWLSSVTAPVDTFWYFKLDTPKTKKKDTPFAEIEPVEELDLVKRPETPLPILGKAKSYQLFLPDPDMIDRLADTFVSEEEAKHADGDTSVPSNGINSDIETLITEPEITTSVSDEVEIKDLVQGSVKERKSKGERRVMIADPPAMIVNEESPSSIRKRLGSFGKLISYQRPRNESPNKYLRPRPRSRSKSRKREEKRRREEEDRQAISDLQNSVQNASYLLDRRRTVGKSTYYGMGSSSSYPTNDSDISISAPERNRGRARERLSTNDAITYSNNEDHKRYSNSSMLSSNSQDLQPNGSAIRGLLGVAQDWLFNHTSRSERSIDRSKSLLRKSKL